MTEMPIPYAGYAPGTYACRCRTCERAFEGDKRALTCRACAEEYFAASLPMTEIRDEIEAVPVAYRCRRVAGVWTYRAWDEPEHDAWAAQGYHCEKLYALSPSPALPLPSGRTGNTRWHVTPPSEESELQEEWRLPDGSCEWRDID